MITTQTKHVFKEWQKYEVTYIKNIYFTVVKCIIFFSDILNP